MKSKYTRFIALVLFLALPSAAFAASQDLGLVNGIVGQFAEVLNKFSDAIQSSAFKLAGVLISAEIAYFWYQKWGSSEVEEISSIVMLLFKHVVLIGFWIWAMNHSEEILGSIYNFFVSTGQAAVPTLNVDNLFLKGIELAQLIPINANLSAVSFLTSPVVTLTTLIAQICLIVAFTVIAAQVLLAKIEFMLIVTAAPIYMAFGVFKFSRDWATKTMSHAVATGTKILLIYMLGGVMMLLAQKWGVSLQTTDLFNNPNQLLEIIGASLMLIILAFFVPSIANSLMSGNTSLSGSSAIMGAMAVGAAAVAGGAGVVKAAGALKDAGKSGAVSVQEFMSRAGGGSMAEIGSKRGSAEAGSGGAPHQPSPPAPAPDMESQIKGDVERVERAQAQGGDVIAAADKRQRAGDASAASIGGAVPPAGAGDVKPKIRDQLAGAADKVGGVFSHAQSMASPFDDKTQVGGANIRVD